MTKYAINGLERGPARDLILQLKPFDTYGALWGTDRDNGAGALIGHARTEYYADRDVIDYVIYSYRTPIAWHTPSGWVRVIDRFSTTTSKHQSAIRFLPDARTVGFNTSGLTDAQRAALIALAIAARSGKPYLTPTGQARRTYAILQARGLVLQDGFNPGEYRLAPDTIAVFA